MKPLESILYVLWACFDGKSALRSINEGQHYWSQKLPMDYNRLNLGDKP